MSFTASIALVNILYSFSKVVLTMNKAFSMFFCFSFHYISKLAFSIFCTVLLFLNTHLTNQSYPIFLGCPIVPIIFVSRIYAHGTYTFFGHPNVTDHLERF